MTVDFNLFLGDYNEDDENDRKLSYYMKKSLGLGNLL